MTPPFTPAMQALWDRAMHLQRTVTSYGVALPQPGTTYARPPDGALINMILFAATAPPEAYDEFAEAARLDMLAWKARVKSPAPPRIPQSLASLEINI